MNLTRGRDVYWFPYQDLTHGSNPSLRFSFRFFEIFKGDMLMLGLSGSEERICHSQNYHHSTKTDS